MGCNHDWVELGTDLERYLFNRNNYAKCLQCRKILKITYLEPEVAGYGYNIQYGSKDDAKDDNRC